jgi:transcription elongation GreA/GreB family factor
MAQKERTNVTTGIQVSVRVGSVITISYGGSRPVSYKIVADGEGDPAQGSIAASAALARAVLGRSIGDNVLVYGPEGERSWATIEGFTVV